MKMSQIGFPRVFTTCLSSWLINRTEWSVPQNPPEHSRSVCPRAHFILPFFFAIYVDYLIADFEMDTFVSAYADDQLTVLIVCNEDMIVASLQPELDKVVVCSYKVRLTLITSKCVTACFSLECEEAFWQTKIHQWWKEIDLQSLTDFLGCQIRLAAHFCWACA